MPEVAVVLGVAPGALVAGRALLADGEALDAGAPVDEHVGEEVAPALVVRDGARLGIVSGGVADVGLADAKVVVPVEAHLALVGGAVDDAHPAHQQVSWKSTQSRAVQHEAELVVRADDVGDERVALVVALDLPAGVAPHPREGAVDEHAEAEGKAAGVVLLAHVRVVEIAQDVIVVEEHEQALVSDGKVARHRPWTVSQEDQKIKRAECVSALAAGGRSRGSPAAPRRSSSAAAGRAPA